MKEKSLNLRKKSLMKMRMTISNLIEEGRMEDEMVYWYVSMCVSVLNL